MCNQQKETATPSEIAGEPAEPPKVTVAAANGATINATPGLILRAQYSAASLIKYATNTWVLVGDLEA